MKNENEIIHRIMDRDYDEAKKSLFECLYGINAKEYIRQLEEYNWRAYFRKRRWSLQPYGYFVYGGKVRQALFQIFRPCRRLIKKVFRTTRNQPKEFFSNHYQYEAKQLKSQFKPRTEEIISHIAEYEYIYELLQDDDSKRTYLCVLMGMLTWKNEWYMRAKFQDETDYYPDFMPNNFEIVIDGGAILETRRLRFLQIQRMSESIICLNHRMRI